MANKLTGHVLYSDAAAALTTKQCRVIGIFWIADQTENKDIAADDDFLLSDGNGDRIIGKRASFIGDDLGVTYGPGLPCKGVTITTMDGGVCYVWITQIEGKGKLRNET